jgi:integrase
MGITPFIRVFTQKTEQTVTIPVKTVVREILDKYKGEPPKGISNQKMNDYLKELGKLAGLNQEVIIRTRKGGVRKEETFPKFELITTHTARRSFATNAYNAKIPSKSIMGITGHKTEREFLKYIKLSSDEHAILMAENPFFD